MAALREYFIELQKREGLEPVELIAGWLPEQIERSLVLIKNATRESEIIGSVIPSFAGTNQSKGNKAAEHFFDLVSSRILLPNQMSPAKGSGYPDKLLTVEDDTYCLELKATSKWMSGDSNRRVLTSSSSKLRSLTLNGTIPAKPHHLLCTVLYDDEAETVTGIRLDFLEPDTEVNIRLEASTSQKLLSNGTQRTEFID